MEWLEKKSKPCSLKIREKSTSLCRAVLIALAAEISSSGQKDMNIHIVTHQKWRQWPLTNFGGFYCNFRSVRIPPTFIFKSCALLYIYFLISVWLCIKASNSPSSSLEPVRWAADWKSKHLGEDLGGTEKSPATSRINAGNPPPQTDCCAFAF